MSITSKHPRGGMLHRFAVLKAGGLLIALLFGLARCGTGGHAPSVGGSGVPTLFGPGKLGGPCDTEGAVEDCGRVDHTDGNYVTCSLGHSTCQAGIWSACVGDHFVTKSAPNVRLTQAGLRVLSGPTTPACSNVCDPYCSSSEPDPADVDASGIEQSDAGGISLVANDGGITVVPKNLCVGLQCQIVTCKTGLATTTLSGTVYDPAGKNPLYDANVYIPLQPATALPAFGSGASCDSCGAAASLDALRATQTDASGHFVLADVPAGANIPVVVQMGKWRREIMLKSVTACADNTVTNNCTTANPADCVFRLPRNHTDGLDPVAGTYTQADMPQTAIITGSADPFDCLLLKAGIDPNEVGDYTSTKRVHYFESDTSPGNKLDPAYGSNVKGSVLWNNLNGAAPSLMSYDVVLLPCEGGAIDKQGASANTPYQNLISYADNGGRAFTTHFSYSWLEYPAGKKYVAAPDNWATVANWAPTGATMTSSINTQDPLTGVVNTSFPKGGVFSQWLQNVGATTTASRLTIHEGRQDLTSIGAGTQPWMTAHDTAYAPYPNYTNLFTFNTPVTAAPADQCGRVVYSDFHVSAKALIAQCTLQACGVTKCGPASDGCGGVLSCGTCKVGQSCGGGGTPGVCGTGSTCVPRTCAAQGIECGPAGDGCGNQLDCGGCAGGQACGVGGPGKCGAHQCLSDTDCGFTASCVGASPGPVGQCSEPCTGSADCPSTSFACAGSVAGTCQEATCTSDANCGVGRTCQGGKCTCSGADDCLGGTCGGMTCSAAACHSLSACGTGICGGGTCAAGFACHKDTECGPTGTCGAGSGSTAGKCSTSAVACHAATECDSGSCGAGTGSTPGTCATNAALCHANTDCDSNSCGLGTGSVKGTCANGVAKVCHVTTDCDSGSCGTGSGATAGTCNTNAKACHSNAACDSGTCGTGTGAVKGTCANGVAKVCHVAGDCDSSSCGSGTGATLGTCSTNAQICHSNAQCDSATCGTGTGAVKGTCANGAAKVCHVTTDCDSASCGTGLGSTPGTCATNAQACHSNAACDSGTCGTGTGAVKGVCANGAGLACHATTDCDSTFCGTGAGSTAGTCATNGQTCHANAACDSGTCGSGTGAVTGACSTNGQICHANATCDSASCGAGVGSTAGVCTAGTCTLSSQCGTGGTCVAGKCTSGSCSIDTKCGTAGGVCTGAKCSTALACAGDIACGVSHVCNGATCGAAATGCAGDAACGVSHVCNGAKCSTPATCAGDSACPSSNSCTGATCGAAAIGCAGDAGCTVSHVCNNSKCSTPATCAGDSACPASNSCTGATCGAAAIGCAGDAGCTVSHLCNNSKCSTPATCAGDSACPASNSCTGATCGAAAIGCAGDAGCTVSHLCNNSKCSTPATCAGDSACPSSNLCTGARCGAPAIGCAGDAACPVSRLCNAAKCSTANCAGDASCGVGHSCVGAKCSTSSCGADTQCPVGACTNAKCSASACSTNSDCGASGGICGGMCQPFTCASDADCLGGTCTNGTCGCATGENCGGAQTCNGAAKGACQKACTQDADCAPDRCINGQCGGCTDSADCHDNSYPTACGGIPAANYGQCSLFQWSQFPEACHPGSLSPQEKALEFMFFDLTACVSPDNLPPPQPVVLPAFYPATFVQDFTATCKLGDLPVWREFDWQAKIPSGASIVLAAQSGADAASLKPAIPVTFSTAIASTNVGPSNQNFDVGLIDTGHNGTGAFNTAKPAVVSGNLLRVTISLNPTPDYLASPTLLQWKVQYDCAPGE